MYEPVPKPQHMPENTKCTKRPIPKLRERTSFINMSWVEPISCYFDEITRVGAKTCLRHHRGHRLVPWDTYVMDPSKKYYVFCGLSAREKA